MEYQFNDEKEKQQEEKTVKKAAAISYEEGQAAPTVLAAGQGFVADKIMEKGEDIPVIENKELVEELTKMELGSHIPPELYEVVAQILIFVSEIDRREGKHGK